LPHGPQHRGRRNGVSVGGALDNGNLLLDRTLIPKVGQMAANVILGIDPLSLVLPRTVRLFGLSDLGKLAYGLGARSKAT
jgi:hypothetical protein